MSRGLVGLALLGLLSFGGCVDGDLDDVKTQPIETHVEDWRDEVIYQLLVDRFANGDPGNDHRLDPSPTSLARFKGGDWQGVIDQLDYLDELGVTTIWISPIVLNVDADAGFDGYHGYWQVDLERLNPHFGDLAMLRTMIQACHERGIKVVLDIVTNHLGQVFYYDINRNGRPDEFLSGGYPTNPGDPQAPAGTPVTRITEYDPDWDPRGIQSVTSLGEAGPAPIRFFDMPEIYRTPPRPAVFQRSEAYNLRGKVTNWNDRDQVVLGDFPGGLKDIETTNLEVRDEMVRVFSDWVLKLDLDGFRIDTLKHVEHEFWQDFTRRVRERLAAAGKNNFLMFGEAFDGDDALVGSYTFPGELDSVFYFAQKFQVYDDVFANAGPTANVQRLLDQRAVNYGSTPQELGIGISPQEALVNFIDNHDVPRFLWRNSDPRALRAAISYLMTQQGIPCLYYGTEQDFAGGNDPANREPLWWSGYARDGETFRWTSRLTHWRRTYPALRRGDFNLRWTTTRTGDEIDAGILAFDREYEGQYALVVINAQGNHASETRAPEGTAMTVGAAAGTVLVDVVTGDRFTVAADQTLVVAVDPYATRLLIPEAQVVAE
ncbi:MAG: alpha-glucosidase C-terminal domain-containing protein [Sandaracinus sp.]|nr:alpha-glucosidase C-terminal domain-containing protein [Sandaracinus sp.]MCB9630987.1 alpha-glucosidase C-terminal domain-containing protein [Sandaracinus sp.]